jgi:hypothetical protein
MPCYPYCYHSARLGPVYCFNFNTGFESCRCRAVRKPDRLTNIKLRRPIEIGTSISPTIPGTAPRILDPSIVTPNNLCCFPQPNVSFVELTSLYFVEFWKWSLVGNRGQRNRIAAQLTYPTIKTTPSSTSTWQPAILPNATQRTNELAEWRYRNLRYQGAVGASSSVDSGCQFDIRWETPVDDRHYERNG